MEHFIKYLQAKNLTKSTQKGYVRYVNKFLSWYNFEELVQSKVEVSNTEKKDILKYLKYLKNKGQQNQTRNKSLIAIRYYFEFLRKTNQIIVNPANLLKIRGIKKQILYKIFTVEELTGLADDYYHSFIRTAEYNHIPKSIIEKTQLTRQRNYLLLTFLVYQGLHTNELLKITIEDIDLIKSTIKIKGRRRTKPRTIKLKVEQIGVLMNYLQNIRPEFLKYYNEETDQLFLKLPRYKNKKSISTNTNDLFSYLTVQVKSISPNFTNFKQIRASVITNWIKTKGLRKAQYLAGHCNTSSTEKYQPNDLEQLTDEIEKYNPFAF